MLDLQYIIFNYNFCYVSLIGLHGITHMNIQDFDTYMDLCTQVYELSHPLPPDDAYAFYREYVKAAKEPVLEPMCGTGRFLLPLLTEGFDVRGFDASKNMLAVLHAKAESQIKN